MTRNANITTLSPLVFSPQQPIIASELGAVSEMMNWAGISRAPVYSALSPGPSGDVVELGALSIVVPAATGTFLTRIRVRPRIDPGLLNILISYQVTVASAGTTIRSRLTAGGASAVTTSHTSAGNGTLTTHTLATSSTGTGLQVITLELERQSGAAVSSLSAWLVQGQRRTTVP